MALERAWTSAISRDQVAAVVAALSSQVGSVPARSAELEQQSESHNAGEPDDARANRDAVEVAFSDGRAAEARRHTTAEQVRQAAAPPFVEQDQQHEHEAREDQQDRERGNHVPVNPFVR
jgi:hypothetical protein